VVLAGIENRTRCVGIEVRSYDRTGDEHEKIKPFEHRDGFAEISSALWRSIPIGDLIERSIAFRKNHYKVLAEAARQGDLIHRGPDDETAARAYESLADDGEPDRPRRGPQRQLSLDDLTRVVAPAYLTGGRKPVVAVQKALSKHKRQTITMEQARKAVVRAREAGVLPPAKGRGKP
jgi:hypothetical protein